MVVDTLYLEQYTADLREQLRKEYGTIGGAVYDANGRRLQDIPSNKMRIYR